MPIIFFLVSLFFSTESAITLNSKSANGTTKETNKPTETPTDGREFIVGIDSMP